MPLHTRPALQVAMATLFKLFRSLMSKLPQHSRLRYRCLRLGATIDPSSMTLRVPHGVIAPPALSRQDRKAIVIRNAPGGNHQCGWR